MRFEYHRIRGAYVMYQQRDATKRIDYGNSYKLFLATSTDMDAERTRIQLAKRNRKANPTA